MSGDPKYVNHFKQIILKKNTLKATKDKVHGTLAC